MAAIENDRDNELQATSPRTLPVQLPPSYSTTGDHQGTLSGSAQSNYQNSQVTLSSTGVLQNAGGGQVTDGASIGNLNAVNIVTGTLNAARIAAGSISSVKIAAEAITTDKIAANAISADKINSNAVTTDKISANAVTAGKLSVSTLSAITANLGTVNAGQITGSADINIVGRALFSGNYTDGGNNASVHANNSKGATYGVYAKAGLGGIGVLGVSDGSGRTGVTGSCTVSGGFGVKAIGTGGATALDVNGPINISTQTISNLTAGNAANASNAGALGGVDDSGWSRIMVTDSGSAAASSFGFVLQSTVTGVRVRATGGRNMVIEEFSDELLKMNESPENLGLDFVLGLEPVTYERQDKPGITYHGIGARKTRLHLEKLSKQKSNDTLGRTLDDGTESVSTIGLIAPLIKAVQELNDKLNELTEQVNRLTIDR